MLRRRMRAPASSSTSIALSGRQRPVMYRSDSSTAALQRRVENLHAVVRFVAVAQALEDFDGVGLARRLDRDRLESAGQGASFSMYLRYSSNVVAPMH
jgi:hypothetical protein